MNWDRNGARSCERRGSVELEVAEHGEGSSLTATRSVGNQPLGAGLVV